MKSSECKICGLPVEAVYEPTGDAVLDAVIKRAAENLVHGACRAKQVAAEADAAAHQRANERATVWVKLCPAQYRSSPEWVRSAAGVRKLKQRPVLAALKWQFGPRGLVLFGAQSGTGKTTCAWVLAKREFDAGKFVVAVTHSELTTEAVKLARGDGEGKWVKLLKACDLLLLDDLGKSRFKSADGTGKCGEELLFDVVDARCNRQLPSLVTSNCSGSEIMAAMSEGRGEPFVRRLREYFDHICFDSK